MTLTTTPLTTEQYTALRGDHRARWLVIPNPNTVMFAGQINQATFATSFAQFTYDSVSVGDYEDVREGWTVYVSHTDDIYESFFRGRVQAVPTSSILYINQTSDAFQNNDYFWVTKDTALFERLPRKEGSTLYWDYNRSYNQLPPSISNLPSVVAVRLIDGGTADVPLSAIARPNTSGTTIASHAWDGDGGVVVAGADDEADVTFQYDAPGWYEVRDTVTDSGGRSSYFAVRVIVYPADYSSLVAPAVICDDLIQDPNTGWGAQIHTNADDDVVEMLDQTEIVIVSEDWFADEPGSLVTNIKFVGRLRGDSTDTRAELRAGAVQITSQTKVNVEGIGAQLGRLILASVTLRRRSSASVLGEIVNLTLWRGMQFLAELLTTLTTIHALDFDDTSNDYAYPLFTAQDRSAESALSDVAFTINAYFNWSPAGQLIIARHMWYMNSTDKAALITIANFDKRDYKAHGIRRDRVPRLGRVIAYGGTYNTASATTLALRAKAPAVVWGPGEGRAQLNRQVLKANLSLSGAQSEMIVRTGAEYASKNVVLTLDTKHPSGYDNVLSASVYQRYTHTIEAASNRVGFACDTSKIWWLQRVAIHYDAIKNCTETDCTWIEDVTSVNAQIIAEIAPDDRPAPVPSFPLSFSTPFLGMPGLQFVNGPDIAPEDEQPYTEKDAQATQKPPEKSTDPEKVAPTPAAHAPSRAGSVVAVGNTNGLWICEDFNVKASPTWRNITPATNITDFRFDPFSGGAYALSNDGATTTVWRADNALNPSWRATSVAGVWTQIRPFGSGGSVAIYAGEALSDGEIENYNFQEGTQGFVPLPVLTGLPYAIYYDDEGWGHGTDDVARIGIQRDLGKQYVRAIWTFNEPMAAGTPFCAVLDYPFPPYTLVASVGGSSDVYDTGSGGYTATDGFACDTGQLGEILTETIRLQHLKLYTGLADPAVAVRVSTDYGVSFEDAVFGGDPLETGGSFDVDLDGGTMYAAGNAQVLETDGSSDLEDVTGGDTTGSFAAALWAKDGGVYMASAASVSGETLWRVEGGKTAITPNDGAADGVVVGPNGLATDPSGELILFLANFGSFVKLARSINGGSTWDFTDMSAVSRAARAKNTEQVYVSSEGSVMYSEDGGANFVTKLAPAVSIGFLEVR